MAIIKIFSKSLAATNKKAKVAAYLWLINFVFSLLVISPAYFLLAKDFSHSLMAQDLVKGFGLLWVGDLILEYQNILPSVPGFVLFSGILFLHLSIFLNGGILGRIVAEEKPTVAAFLGDSCKYFFRFLRVFLLSIIGYFLVLGILYRLVGKIFNLWTKNAASEWLVLISNVIKLIILVLLFSVVRMFFDYVRASLVADESKKTISKTLAIFKFMARNFFKALGLYFLVALLLIIFTALYFCFCGLLPHSGALALASLFLLNQIYLFSTLWTKMLFLSSEYHYYLNVKSA